jgi:hypothetical protein
MEIPALGFGVKKSLRVNNTKAFGQEEFCTPDRICQRGAVGLEKLHRAIDDLGNDVVVHRQTLVGRTAVSSNRRLGA